MATLSVTDEDELVAAVCAARAAQRTMEIVGGGTKRALGRPMSCDDMLDISGLSSIVSYEPEELVLTVQAGTPLAEIEAVIGARRQCLGFEPVDWGPLFGAESGRGTIAGALAADCAGSARVRFGGARDHLLGFRAVNGFGEAYKGGGRVVKNVTGFDISKLMCGAFGTLGPLSEVTLRLIPKAPQSLTLAVRDLAPEEGLRLLRRVWASPLEATGLAFVPACVAEGFDLMGGIGAGAALLRVEGAPDVLGEKRAALQRLLDGHDAMALPHGDAVFRYIAMGGVFVDRAVDVWRIAVPPAQSAETAQSLAGTIWLADWAGGLFWVGLSQTDAAAVRQLRHIASRAQGHATLLRAAADVRAVQPVFPPQPQALAALTRSVKVAFDPLGLFNPGRMTEGA